MIRGVHHISLATPDLDRLLHFYHELLGMELLGIYPLPTGEPCLEEIVGMKNLVGRTAVLNLGNITMEIFSYSNPVPKPGERRPACDTGIRHICFDTDDAFGEWERLKAAGVQAVSDGPVKLPEEIGAASIYLYDPDGNICELQQAYPGGLVKPLPNYRGEPV